MKFEESSGPPSGVEPAALFSGEYERLAVLEAYRHAALENGLLFKNGQIIRQTAQSCKESLSLFRRRGFEDAASGTRPESPAGVLARVAIRKGSSHARAFMDR